MELIKKIALITSISLLCFLASCKTITSPIGMVKNTPDVLPKPTKTVLVAETKAELPKSVIVTTSEKLKTEVLLVKETVATTTETKEEIILPKNTPVILPEKTEIQTTCNTLVLLDGNTEVVLPSGTEITIRKVNWYALLFYCLLMFGSAFYYIKFKAKNTNGGGKNSTKTDKK
jgi:hypothetical protein